MVQSHILEHGNLQYDNFMASFLKLIVSNSVLYINSLSLKQVKVFQLNFTDYFNCFSVKTLANMCLISLNQPCHI